MTLPRKSLVPIVLAAAASGCGGQSDTSPPQPPAAPMHVAKVIPREAPDSPHSVVHRDRRKIHYHRAAPPPSSPHTKTAPPARTRPLAVATCAATREGLRKVVGTHVSPAETSAAPAVVARLQGLQRREADAAVNTAVAKATTLAKEWGAVLVIGPGDKRRAERLGRQVISAVGDVNAAAKAAGLGACAIPLG